MRWFKKEEEDFDDSTAFDSDKSALLKIIFIAVVFLILIVAIIFISYNQFTKWMNPINETLNETRNDTDKIILAEGKIIINFTDFNLTVDENPDGLYYYTTQEKVTGEKCYIDGKRKTCDSLTNSVCSEKECKKDLITVTECFVNSKKIDCPK